MRYHHNELNYRRRLLAEDWSLDDAQDYEDMTSFDDLESLEEKPKVLKPIVRKRIDDYLEQKRLREQDRELFDQDYYYDDD